MAMHLQISFEPDLGWVLSETAPGIAGSARLPLGNAAIEVDALEPEHLVEWVVPADERTDPLPDQAAAVIEACFGPACVQALRALTRDDDAPAALAVTPTQDWSAVARLARAELALQHRRPVTDLAALDVVHEGRALAIDVVRDLVERRALQALPAVGGLRRLAVRRPALVDQLGPGARTALRTRLQQVAALVAALGAGARFDALLRDLLDLLTPVTDTDLSLLLVSSAFDLDVMVTAASALRGDGEALRVDWRCSPADLTTELGSAADAAFTGVVVTGQIPGTLDLVMPLAPGAELDRFHSLQVRMLTWEGEVLADQPLVVATNSTGMPTGRCRLRVTCPLNGASLADHGVVIDLAVLGRPSPTASRLKDLARRRARLAGRRAVLAAQNGQARLAAQHWRRTAALFAAAGDEPQAARARAAVERTGQDHSGDWLAQLQAALERAAGEVCREGAEHDVRALIRDLSMIFPDLPELAIAHERLADQLSGSSDGDDRADVLEHLQAALRIWLSVGSETHARNAQRRLSALTQPGEA